MSFCFHRESLATSENNFAACFAATLQAGLILNFLIFPMGMKALLDKNPAKEIQSRLRSLCLGEPVTLLQKKIDLE